MSQCRPLDWARDCLEDQGPPLEPYGDISGVGVIIGFVGTGYFVLVLMILNYLVSYDPTRSPWPGHESKHHWRPNPVDVVLLRKIRRIKETELNPFQHRTSYLQHSIEKSILSLCDIQIATGLSILTSAFILGLQCGLDAYHWQMIVHLSWFSAVTHLSGLFALRGTIAKRRWAKYVRIGLMFCLLLMLLVATIPTVFFNWPRVDVGPGADGKSPLSAANPSSTAICFLDVNYGVRRYHEQWERQSDPDQYQTLHGTHKLQITLFSVVLLVFGFATRSVKLFGPLSRLYSSLIREPVSSLGQVLLRKAARRQSNRDANLLNDVFMRLALAIFITMRLAANLAGSMVAEVYWLFCLVIWGTLNIISTRGSIQQNVVQEEGQWTFGQILPVLLLVGPIIAITSTIASDFFKCCNLPNATINRPWDAMALTNPNIGTQAVQRNGPNRNGLHEEHNVGHSEATRQATGNCVSNELAQGLSASPTERDLEWWLDHTSSMVSTWMPICMMLPCIFVFLTTVALLGSVFNFNDNMSPGGTLFEMWISDVGLAFVLFVDYPTASTVVVLLGMRLNSWILDRQRRPIKNMTLFAICSTGIYGSIWFPAGIFIREGPDGRISTIYSVRDPESVNHPPFLLRPYVFSFLKFGLVSIFYLAGYTVRYIWRRVTT